MDSVVHFERPYEERGRMAKFYQTDGNRVSLLQPLPRDAPGSR
jgi:hypothetical protein